MKKLLLLLMLLAVPLAFAQEEASWLYQARNLVIDFNISGSLNVDGSSGKVSSVNSELYLFPRSSYRQEILSINSSPDAVKHDDYYNFYWGSLSSGSHPFSINSNLKNTNEFKRVTAKVGFPFVPDPAYAEFTKPSEKIDSDDPEIVALANQLASGETDLLVIETKLANYVKDNVNYDLTSLTADVSQKASWVLDNKEGVCDELTSLFIALNRALGVPSRFVKGVSYTNSPLFNYSWGPHAWAEVYFPGYGWIPFDVTYAEFGYIDATHIELDYSVDSDKPSTKYSWKSSGTELTASKLDVSAHVSSSEGLITDLVSIDAILMDDDVGFGSYAAVEAVIKNPNPYYVPVTVLISKTSNLELLSPRSYRILLKPNTEQKVFWKMKVDDSLSKDYVYTFPIVVQTLGNISDSLQLHSSRREKDYSEDNIDYWLGIRKDDDEKTYSKNVAVNCSSPETDYVGSSVVASCLVRNEGNVLLDGLNVCLGSDCKNFSLGISQSKSVDFSFSAELDKRYSVSVVNRDVSKVVDLDLDVLDFPELLISNVSVPSDVGYEQAFDLKFVVEPVSRSSASDVVVQVRFGRDFQKWDFANISEPTEFTLSLEGKNLKNGANEMLISVDYEDNNAKKYSADDSVSVNLSGLTFVQRIVNFFRHLF